MCLHLCKALRTGLLHGTPQNPRRLAVVESRPVVSLLILVQLHDKLLQGVRSPRREDVEDAAKVRSLRTGQVVHSPHTLPREGEGLHLTQGCHEGQKAAGRQFDYYTMSTENPGPEVAEVPPSRPKQPRTEAQQEAFARAQAARASNVQARRAAAAEQHELARKIMEEKYGEKVNTVLGPRGRGQPSREEKFLLAEAKETLAMVRDQVQQAKVVEVPVMASTPSVTTKVLQAPKAAAAPEPAPAPEVKESDGEQEMEALAEMVMQRMQRAQVAKKSRKGRRRRHDSDSDSSESESDDERDRSRRERRRDQPPPPPPPPAPPVKNVPTPVKPKRNIIFLS